jgi:hypothetical protein
MSIAAVEITLKKIKYLEEKRKLSFREGIERYVLGPPEEKENYFMYSALLDELHSTVKMAEGKGRNSL